ARLLAIADLGVETYRAAAVAEAHRIARGNAEPPGVVGMDQDRRPPLLADRGRSLGEGGVEVVARGRRHEPERVLVVDLVDDREVIRQLRHARVVGAELRPVRLELELAGRRGKTV